MCFLFFLIVIPLFLSFITVLFFVPKYGSISERIRFSFTLHPELGLIKQGWLWFVIITPLYYFFATSYFSWRDYNILLNSDGFQTFINISLLPLGLLSVSIPLSVLISRMHSTEQTAKQIEIVSYKNNLDTYRSHRQDLFSYFDQIGEVNFLGCLKVKFKAHPRLHKNFFKGDPKNGLPIPNIDAFKDIESELKSARWGIDGVIRGINPEHTLDFYLNTCSCLYRLSMKLGISEINIDLVDRGVRVPVKIQGQPETESLLTIGTTTDEYVTAFRVAKSFYYNLCDFSGYIPNIEPDERMKYVDTGGKYKKINKNGLVVEKLHETVIKEAIATSKANEIVSKIDKF